MDDNQKNQTSDFSSFAGSYPEEKTDTSTTNPPLAPADSVAPAVSSPIPAVSSFATEPAVPPVAPTTPTNDVAPFAPPLSSTSPVAPPTTDTNPFAATTFTASADPAVAEPVAAVPPPPAGQEPVNPFTTVSSQPPGGPKNIKRILAIIALLVLLLVIGFLAFTVIGRLLSGRQPVVLNYWGLWENEQVLTSLIEEYQQSHPNVQVAYTRQTIRQYRERLQAAIGRGEGPDIFRFHNTWVPMLKDDLAPAAATGYTAAEFQQTFYPVMSQDLVLGNQVAGVPMMFDGLGLYYNEDLLRSAGITPPTSWEEFRNAALTLTVKDQAGQIITAGAALGTATNIEHFSDILAVMMLQNGADLKNPTSSEAQQALSFYRLFADQPSNVWDDTLDNSILAFANGKVAMIFAPSWQVFTIREMNPQLKFQIIPIPQLPGTTVTWASYWAEGVSNKSAHKDEAWEFLKFISSKEAMIRIYTEQSKLRPFGEPYSRIDLAQTLINDPFVGAYIRQAPTAQSFFLASRTFDNGINDRMIKYLEDAVNSQARGVGPDEALKTAAQGFSQVLSSFGYQ